MVFFHGGAFVTGSGSRDLYGPEYLVAEGVVLLTVNYRLGALGNFNSGIIFYKTQLFNRIFINRQSRPRSAWKCRFKGSSPGFKMGAEKYQTFRG